MFSFVYTPDTPEVFQRAAEIMRERGLTPEWTPWDDRFDAHSGGVGVVSAVAMAKGATYEEVSESIGQWLEGRYLSQLEGWLLDNCIQRCTKAAGVPTSDRVRISGTSLTKEMDLSSEQRQEIESWYAANTADILASVDLRRDLVPAWMLERVNDDQIIVIPEETGVPTIINDGHRREPEEGFYHDGGYGHDNFYNTNWWYDEDEANNYVDPSGPWAVGPDQVVARGAIPPHSLNELTVMSVGERARRALKIMAAIPVVHVRECVDNAAEGVEKALKTDPTTEPMYLVRGRGTFSPKLTWLAEDNISDQLVLSTPQERDAARTAGDIEGHVALVKERVADALKLSRFPAATIGEHFAEPRSVWMDDGLGRPAYGYPGQPT